MLLVAIFEIELFKSVGDQTWNYESESDETLYFKCK